MQLEEFLALILPERGVYFLTMDIFAHRPYTDIATLSNHIRRVDKAGKTVHFACASFKQPQYIDGKGKVRYRTHENALAAKAFWLDIDCGAEKKDHYADQKSAEAAVRDMCGTTGMPVPLIVSSGHGVHCYWPIERELPADSWLTVARRMRWLFENNGLRFDHSRDTDISSILRPIETVNRKRDPQTLVYPLHEISDPFKLADLFKVLAKTPSTPSYVKAENINSDLATKPEDYPEVDIDRVVEGCAQVRHVKETGGTEYEAWRCVVGLLKFVKDGEELAHEWSSQYPKYSRKETDEKYQTWEAKPPTCATFANAGSRCDGCTHKGSPVSLGFVQRSHLPAGGLLGTGDTFDPKKAIPFGYSINEKERLCRLVKDKKTDLVEPMEICSSFFYPIERVQTGDGIMSAVWESRHQFMGNPVTRRFTLPTSLIGEKSPKLHGVLAQQEIVFEGKHRTSIEDYMTAWITKLKETRESTRAYTYFGWQPDKSFLLGDTLYGKDGQSRIVKLSGDNIKQFSKAFENTGREAEKWTELIHQAYNFPEHEQFWYTLMTGFGAPLMDLWEEDTGALVMLLGGKGEGKSTVANMAASIYGDPSPFHATWKSGITFNAAITMLSIAHSMPCLFDEFSNIDPKGISDVAYAFGNGKEKRRSRADGTIYSHSVPFRSLNHGTTNTDVHQLLTVGKDDPSAELARIFQLNWRNVSGRGHTDIVRFLSALTPHYGAAAKVFIPYVTAHRGELFEQMLKLKDIIDDRVGLTKEYRFWSRILAASLLGGHIATHKLGLLKFDYKAAFDYAIDQGRMHVKKVGGLQVSPVDSFHDLITSKSNRVIKTRIEGDARSVPEKSNVHSGPPIARVIMDEGVMYVTKGAIRDWCNTRGIKPETMALALNHAGLMLDDDARFNIGKGTDVQTGQHYCWKIDWVKFDGENRVPVDFPKPRAVK